MKIEYDDKFDLLYIRFDDTQQQVINQRVNDNIVLDLGVDNMIVGIEILDAKSVLDLKKILPIQYLNYRKEEFALT